MLRKKWIVLLLCILVVSAVVAGVFCVGIFTPDYQMQIQLNGERIVIVERGADYSDPGASAALLNRGKDTGNQIPVTVSTNVDTQTLGTYTVCYTASFEKCVGTAYRRVKVIDPDKPVITLSEDPERSPVDGEPYREEGYTAADNLDGDITDRVERVESDGIITYTVSDSAGNTAIAVRNIDNTDTLAPKLSLNGYNTVTLKLGDEYVEAGFMAMDNRDGDLTEKVKVSGSYNTKKAGRYALTYSVTDRHGNSTSKTRVIFVKDPSVTRVNDPNKGSKFIYLTFDDGPGAHTDRLLDILAKYNVPATFFVVNTGYIDTIKRTSAEGHTVAIHSVTHNFRQIYASEEAFFNDIYQMQDIIQYHTGKTAKLLRFPGGGSNTVSRFNRGIMSRLTKMVEEEGFVYFDWNVDCNDAGGARSASEVYQNVVLGVTGKTEAVVLMHDIKQYSVDAVEKIILWGLDNGYTFLPLTENSPTCHHRIKN